MIPGHNGPSDSHNTWNSSQVKVVAMIPARMGSTRYPGKPLAPILGRPMIEHIYRRVALSSSVSATYIATCDQEIRAACEGFGAPALMTGSHHERASDRIAEAAEQVEGDIIVMVQGDEPMVVPEMIDRAVARMLERDDPARCVNLSKRIESESEFLSPNTIKVVIDQRNRALYMTRQPIPTLAKSGFADTVALKQVCIIPFTREALHQFSRLPPTPLEVLESIDMMRFIEHGHPVHMVATPYDSHAVDCPADRDHVEALMAEDPLCQAY